MRFHYRFILREVLAAKVPLLLFSLCVFLASLAITIATTWKGTVNESLAEETRKSAGGDVIVFSTEAFSEGVLQASAPYEHIFSSEMFTVALATKSEEALFSKLKAVQPPYPYLGEVSLKSGGDLHEALLSGLVVETRVMERLELAIGDQLKLGEATFPVVDVALSEPDRPLGMWGVSPRIFISEENLAKTELLKPESYAERRIHIKLENREASERVAEELRAEAIPDQERVESWKNPPVSLERYVKNFFTYLDMIVILGLSLGGLGIQSTLSSWLQGRQKSVASVLAIGGKRSFIFVHYGAIILLATSLGYGLSLFASNAVLSSSGELLSRMLPIQVDPHFTLTSVCQAAAVSYWVSLAFAAWPLYLCCHTPPSSILRHQDPQPPRGTRQLFMTICGLAMMSLLAWSLGNIKLAFYVALALSGVLLTSYVFSQILVKILVKWRPDSLALRTSLGAWRSPDAKAGLVVFVLSTCLSILFTCIICQEALRQSWIDAMPAESPNLIFFDIQEHQLETFESLIPTPHSVYQSLRVRIQTINGQELDRSGSRRYWQMDGRGKLDAQPTLELPSNDTLFRGESLYQGEDADQVSVRKDIAKALDLKIGDKLSFNIQGIPIEATISSLRSSTRKGFQPSFELLFPPALVEGAPRRIFSSTRLPEQDIGRVQASVARALPSVVSMDLSHAVKLIAERLFQMMNLIFYFLGLGLVTGLLILISVVLSSRQRRRRESAYYKMLGAKNTFLVKVLWMENLVLGLASSGLALFNALLASYALCAWALDVPFPSMPLTLLGMLCLPALVVSLLAWFGSYSALKAAPNEVLRA